jgi:hypothetical protein
MQKEEDWCYRRMMRISRVDGVRNKEVFARAGKRERVWLREDMDRLDRLYDVKES